MKTGKELVDAGYFQTSRAYRLVAKLPEGKSAIDALAAHDPRMAAHFLSIAERAARGHYLRGRYAEADGNSLALTEEEFADFIRTPGKEVA